MTEPTLEYLDLSVASVATILVDGLDGAAVTDLLATNGLDYEVHDDLVATRLYTQDGDSDPYAVLVDFDTADGVLHVHSTDLLDAYGLAPKASTFLDALDAAESQSLFTYTVSFDHPLVTFSTLVDYLDDDRTAFRDPTGERDDRSAVNSPAFPATDGDEPPAEGEWDDETRPEPAATSPRRPHLEVVVDGDVFELYEDGYLLPVDDASRDAVLEFLAAVNERLATQFPDPPESVDAAELPDGWAGPLLARHPEAGVVVDRWTAFVDGASGDPSTLPFDDGSVAGTAETVLDLAVSLVYAVDHLSPDGRALYYDRYRDDETSPLRIPLVDGEGNLRDREAFLTEPLWVQETERVVAESRREIRDLADAVATYEGRDLRAGQVWRYRTGEGERTLRIVGRESAGGRFVSLPVWVGTFEADDEERDDAADEPVVVDGDALVELVADAE